MEEIRISIILIGDIVQIQHNNDENIWRDQNDPEKTIFPIGVT